MNKLANYQNGDYHITIYDTGTKIRKNMGRGEHVAFPESIDLKITNRCNAECEFCHEGSLVDGKHADFNKLKEALEGLPAGIELAIGGGNPFEYPQLVEFLRFAKEKGFICNITINAIHISENLDVLKQLVNEQLIHGIGVSLTEYPYLSDIVTLMRISPNVVIHTVLGITDWQNVFNLSITAPYPLKIVVLGYKRKGRGVTYYNSLRDFNVICEEAIHFLESPIYTFNIDVIAFDNLAIEQLNIDVKDTPFYMGDDGEFTMYYDAVTNKAAISSTSKKRESCNNILEFWTGKNNKKQKE